MAEYIERESLMKNFCGYDLTKCVKYGNKDAEQQHNSYSTMMMYEIADEIMDAPAADVAPVVHGRWEKWNGDDRYHCTVCECYANAERERQLRIYRIRVFRRLLPQLWSEDEQCLTSNSHHS